MPMVAFMLALVAVDMPLHRLCPPMLMLVHIIMFESMPEITVVHTRAQGGVGSCKYSTSEYQI